MGGNALKNTHTRRYAAAEYYALYEGLAKQISSMLCANSMLALIPSYRAKETFGDMDLLYSGEPLSVGSIKRALSPNEVIKNGDVISFDYHELQIDLINTKTPGYSLAYFSYNDLGNLVGKLARRHGLKHGHTGLYLPVRSGTHFLKEILVTTDHDEALEFLDLDPAIFHAGFDDLSDIFNYVASSKYFAPSSYALENVSSKGRVRDKKRHTYQEFLKFCGTCDTKVLDMGSDKAQHLPGIFKRWPHVREEFQTVTNDLLLREAANAKLNGSLVAELTGLTGTKLGEFMRQIRTHEILGDNCILVHLTHATIQQQVKDLYAQNF